MSAPYAGLDPATVLDALESAGLRGDGRLLSLNSYENRVYQIYLEDDTSARDNASVVAKFYRPDRWSNAQIAEEHAFALELAGREIPVVAPTVIGGRTLHVHAGFRFAVYPRRGGRAPDLDRPETLEWIGRFIGRIHAVGATAPFLTRPALDPETFGHEPRDWLLDSDFIPDELREAWESIAALALDGVEDAWDAAGEFACIRLHGDCHPGNILWTHDGPHFVDLDDARSGPAMQDLWMLLSGEREAMARQLGHVLAGYEQFHDFDRRELRLLEALRTLRLLHYSAWIARRWDDPAFPAAFPWFDTQRYWQDRILELREQVAAMDETPADAAMTSLSLMRSFRWSYMPPLMVYVAAGIQGLTGIVGTFFVKEYLGLSAEFLAALGFWAGLPWALKMPVGHLVDLVWRWKEALVFFGAGLLTASILIMIGLLADPDAMRKVMSAEHWFVLAALIAPVGYMVQDVVADAMTVEAVPRVDGKGDPLPAEERKAMHITMQTLGRVAIIGGTVLVALANVFFMSGVDTLPEPDKVAAYLHVYQWALAIPAVSVAGVALQAWLRRRNPAQYRHDVERPPVNWWVLGGGLAFTAVSLSVGLGRVPMGQELIFAASMAIIVFLIVKLVRELDPAARSTLVGTAVVIFVFRAMPGPGAGGTWWMIDELKFDQQFISVLSLVGSALTLAGLFVFRRFMAERSIFYVVGFLTVAGGIMSLPQVGMYYGLHEWTAAHTGGVVDARFIALVDTALESPLGQIAMVPMLAWIANSAPERLKATYFAVMASFTNLALSAAQLGTKYLNQWFTVTREVKDPVSNAIKVPADYSELGMLFITVTLIGLLVPLAAIAVVRRMKMRSA